ncbi:MAG: hypothetical protein HOV80_25215, partial [Polyangiaceae bacterium]|nr:hypothetical protein [Polyangiaceae bacterium]
EETRCDGKIKKGCETVKYGGPSVQVAPKRLSGELNPWFFWGREIVDVITIIFGGRALFKDWSKLGRIYKMIDVAGLAWTGIDKTLGYTGMVLSQTNYAAAKWLGDNVTDTWWYKSVGWTVGLTGMGRNVHQWRGEQLARNAANATPPTSPAALPAPSPQLALPAPEPRLALPAPEPRLALPAPEPRLALPAPQQQLALPAPQQQLALPAPQQQLALPAPQQQLALPAPQQQLALPAPKPQLALPAPQPQLALPPPSGGTPPTGG